MSSKSIFGVFALVLFLFSAPILAAEGPVQQESATDLAASKRAQQLLQRAVSHYTQNGERALAAFSHAGEFIDGDYYVYVLNLKGIMLASGGSSSALIGRNVTNMVDARGKPFFREMIAGAASAGSGQVEYRWLNRVDNKVERKIAYYQRVNDKILAVGFYIPRASPEQAKKLLDEAAQAIAADPEKAFTAFNDLGSRFIQDDLYVFAVGLTDARFRAHGTMSRLIGTNALELRDPKGKAIIQEMINIVEAKGEGQLEYDWQNPVTNRVESKHTFIRKVGDYLVGVGYYSR